ncbi:MAG TPA: hypothetical protein V6C86_06290 [Oculatellaceae cyanobacterium]
MRKVSAAMVSGRVLALILATSFSQPAYCAADLLADAERLYAVGELDLARETVLQELALHPSNAAAHYLLGNVYLRDGDKLQAIKQYAAAYTLAPTSSAGKYSKSVLNRLTQSSTDEAAPLAQTSAVDSAQTSDKEQTRLVTKETERKTKELGSVISPTQVADLSNHEFSLECDQRVKILLEQQNKAIAELKKDTGEQLSLNDANYRIRADQHENNEGYRSIIREYKRKRKLIEDDTTKRCDEVRAYYRAKEDALRESALSASEAYNSKSKSVKLVPLGTNIYTRSYQTLSQPSNGAIPLQAPPAKALSVL